MTVKHRTSKERHQAASSNNSDSNSRGQHKTERHRKSKREAKALAKAAKGRTKKHKKLSPPTPPTSSDDDDDREAAADSEMETTSGGEYASESDSDADATQSDSSDASTSSSASESSSSSSASDSGSGSGSDSESGDDTHPEDRAALVEDAKKALAKANKKKAAKKVAAKSSAPPPPKKVVVLKAALDASVANIRSEAKHAASALEKKQMAEMDTSSASSLSGVAAGGLQSNGKHARRVRPIVVSERHARRDRAGDTDCDDEELSNAKKKPEAAAKSRPKKIHALRSTRLDWLALERFDPSAAGPYPIQVYMSYNEGCELVKDEAKAARAAGQSDAFEAKIKELKACYFKILEEASKYQDASSKHEQVLFESARRRDARRLVSTYLNKHHKKTNAKAASDEGAKSSLSTEQVRRLTTLIDLLDAEVREYDEANEVAKADKAVCKEVPEYDDTSLDHIQARLYVLLMLQWRLCDTLRSGRGLSFDAQDVWSVPEKKKPRGDDDDADADGAGAGAGEAPLPLTHTDDDRVRLPDFDHVVGANELDTQRAERCRTSAVARLFGAELPAAKKVAHLSHDMRKRILELLNRFNTITGFAGTDKEWTIEQFGPAQPLFAKGLALGWHKRFRTPGVDDDSASSSASSPSKKRAVANSKGKSKAKSKAKGNKTDAVASAASSSAAAVAPQHALEQAQKAHREAAARVLALTSVADSTSKEAARQAMLIANGQVVGEGLGIFSQANSAMIKAGTALKEARANEAKALQSLTAAQARLDSTRHLRPLSDADAKALHPQLEAITTALCDKLVDGAPERLQQLLTIGYEGLVSRAALLPVWHAYIQARGKAGTPTATHTATKLRALAHESKDISDDWSTPHEQTGEAVWGSIPAVQWNEFLTVLTVEFISRLLQSKSLTASREHLLLLMVRDVHSRLPYVSMLASALHTRLKTVMGGKSGSSGGAVKVPTAAALEPLLVRELAARAHDILLRFNDHPVVNATPTDTVYLQTVTTLLRCPFELPLSPPPAVAPASPARLSAVNAASSASASASNAVDLCPAAPMHISVEPPSAPTAAMTTATTQRNSPRAAASSSAALTGAAMMEGVALLPLASNNTLAPPPVSMPLTRGIPDLPSNPSSPSARLMLTDGMSMVESDPTLMNPDRMRTALMNVHAAAHPPLYSVQQHHQQAHPHTHIYPPFLGGAGPAPLPYGFPAAAVSAAAIPLAGAAEPLPSTSPSSHIAVSQLASGQWQLKVGDQAQIYSTHEEACKAQTIMEDKVNAAVGRLALPKAKAARKGKGKGKGAGKAKARKAAATTTTTKANTAGKKGKKKAAGAETGDDGQQQPIDIVGDDTQAAEKHDSADDDDDDDETELSTPARA